METPIYEPGLASTQDPRTAHWRLVMCEGGWQSQLQPQLLIM